MRITVNSTHCWRRVAELCGAALSCALCAPTVAAQVTRSGAAAPHAKAVTIVIFENRDYSAIVGAKDAPYLNASLVPLAAVMTNSHAIAHPSEPNYVEL